MKKLIVILLLASSCFAQTTPKHLLGEKTDTAIKVTPLGFRYVDGGYDRVRKNKIAKSEDYLRRKGVPEDVITAFKKYAAEVGQKNYFPQAIDGAWLETKARALACGENSKAAKAARAFDPRSVTIYVEAGSFWIQYWSRYANGAVMDKNTIRMTAVAMHYLSQPQNASLVRFDALARWELPNILGMKAGYKITDVSQEIGDGDICSKLR